MVMNSHNKSHYQIYKEQQIYEQQVKDIMGEYKLATKKLEKNLEKTRHELIKVMKGVAPNKKAAIESPELKPQPFQKSTTSQTMVPDDTLNSMIVGVTLKSSHRVNPKGLKDKTGIVNKAADVKTECTSEVRKNKKLVILSKSPKKPTDLPAIGNDLQDELEYANIPQLNFSSVLDVIVPPIIETNELLSPIKGQLATCNLGLRLQN